jgi:hypothetical protein
VRERYKLCALKYHPDKCKLPDATERFQAINDAYIYLKKRHEHAQQDMCDYEDDSETEDETYVHTYKTMIAMYLSRFFRNVCDTDIKQRIAKIAISKIVGLCEQKATEYVRRLDVSTLSKIYEILVQYKDAFHISEHLLTVVRDILSQKAEDNTCILLNPFLEDLQADNLYKITESGQTYIVPLWHHELLYDCSGADLLVRCCPVLPEHMEIDEDNNVIVHLEYTLSELWENKDEIIRVPFGNTFLDVFTKALKITRSPQTICIPGAGISRINRTNMFDNSRRTDVYLVITIGSL